jgi:hypothetical protein
MLLYFFLLSMLLYFHIDLSLNLMMEKMKMLSKMANLLLWCMCVSLYDRMDVYIGDGITLNKWNWKIVLFYCFFPFSYIFLRIMDFCCYTLFVGQSTNMPDCVEVKTSLAEDKQLTVKCSNLNGIDWKYVEQWTPYTIQKWKKSRKRPANQKFFTEIFGPKLDFWWGHIEHKLIL